MSGKYFLIFTLSALVAACGSEGGSGGSGNSGHSHQVASGLPGETGFPAAVVPANAKVGSAAFELGRSLFYEKRLSGNGQQACASCHQQDKAFTDGLARAIGSTGELHPRNTQSLANVAYNSTLTWVNPTLTSLERQMETPLFGTEPVEMGINDVNKEEVLQRLRSDPALVSQFETAFPEQVSNGRMGVALVDFDNIISAISTFQRELISSNSRYDKYLDGKGDLTPQELRGLALFNGEKAECFHCHGSFNFNDQVQFIGQVLEPPQFHNTGLYNIDGKGGFPEPNVGLIEFTGSPQDMGKFRAQSLRNVELTAPYMHDGSMSSLEEVVEFYSSGGRVIASGPNAGDGRKNPYKSDLIVGIGFTDQEKSDLVAFLKSLTDREFTQNPRFSRPN